MRKRIVRKGKKITRCSKRKKQERKVKNDMLFCPRDKAIYLTPFKEFKTSNACRKSMRLRAKHCCRRSCRKRQAKLVTSLILYTSKPERTQIFSNSHPTESTLPTIQIQKVKAAHVFNVYLFWNTKSYIFSVGNKQSLETSVSEPL